MPLSRENRHLTVPIVIIVASLVIIGIGAQAWIASREDRARTECLEQFGADIVTSLNASRTANARLTRAQGHLTDAGERKDNALDRLITISQQAQQSGAQSQEDLPPGLLDEYERVLAERVKAQRAYDRVKTRVDRLQAEADATRAANPLQPPKLTCKA